MDGKVRLALGTFVLSAFLAAQGMASAETQAARDGLAFRQEDQLAAARAALASRQTDPARGAPLLVKANETCHPNLILCGQVVQSTLATTDCSTSGGYADLWAFPAYSPQAAASGLTSPDFAGLFGLVDPTGTVIDAAEAPVGGFATFADYLTIPGNYEILVAAQQTSANKTGGYTLDLVCVSGAGSRCNADAATLCLLQHRFRIQVGWHNQFNDTYGFGRAVTSTDSVGFFSFGDPSNIELLVKILNFGDSIKVFYGELTNLEFSVAVSDMDDPAQRTKTYSNTPGNCGGIDADFLHGSRSVAAAAASGGGCKPDKNTICLLNRRFALTMTWHNQFNDTSGVGGSVRLSDVTGAFYFTDKSDLELVAKVIDFGDRIAVFYGSLSNLEYDLTVTDTSSGAQKVYHNAAGNECGGLDNTAFP
jgi:hypothetical protein